MIRTAHRFDWENGFYKIRTLSRSFDTYEEAQAFATGKEVLDIYRSKGKYKVEWLKTAKIDD